MTWIIVLAGVVVVGFLGVNLFRRFRADRLAELTDRRRATSRMVGRGEFVDGNRHLEVALALTDSTFFYENPDMEASLDLEWVQEVEYDSSLATGAAIPNGKVLRLRCHSQTFEFVLPPEMASRWSLALPARRAAAI